MEVDDVLDRLNGMRVRTGGMARFGVQTDRAGISVTDLRKIARIGRSHALAEVVGYGYT